MTSEELLAAAKANKIRAVARALVSSAFELCQPDKADVFGWIDDNADKIAAHIVESTK